MGRIVTSVTVTNVLVPDKSARLDVLMDTGASHLALPRAWIFSQVNALADPLEHLKAFLR